MTLARSDALTLMLDNAAKLLADSATFRTLMGVATPALAYAKCWLWETDDANSAEQASYPRAILAHTPGSHRSKRITTSSWLRTGAIDISIQIECPSEYRSTPQDAYTYISNKAGAVGTEIETLVTSGVAATLNSPSTHLDVTEYAIEECGLLDLCHENGNQILGADLVLHWKGK